MKAIYKLSAMLTLFFYSVLTPALADETTAQRQQNQNDAINIDEFDMRHDELTGLLNWASYLSGYKTNGDHPKLVFKPRQFFIDNACFGNDKCRVVGWYNDRGVVYIDDKLSALESRFERSLVVHEFVHYLQHISGNFSTGSCEEFVQREREAYTSQREFIMAYGTMPSMSFHQHSCNHRLTQNDEIAKN